MSGQPLVMSSLPVVYIDPEPAPGTWGSDSRDRVGKTSVSHFFGPIRKSRVHGESDLAARSNRILTDEELWEVYLRCPDVRAPVDAICRRVSTWDWVMEPTVDPASDQHEAAEREAMEAAAFFQAPNEDGEPIQVLFDKYTRDLLIVDHGVWELVYDSTIVEDPFGRPTGDLVVGDDLQEIVALRGSEVWAVRDEFGRLLGYVQNQLMGGGSALVVPSEDQADFVPTFEPKQILAQNLSANTLNERTPLIETIINEVIALCLSSQHAMRAFDSEIPPGILVLLGISGKAADDAKADLKSQRGRGDHLHVLTSPDPTSKGAHWVELQHTAKDVDFVNVTKEIRRTIWRNFGVLPIEMGASEDIPRAVGAVQLDVSASHLINPILELLEQKINAQLVPLLPGGKEGRIRFRFDRETKLSPEEQRTKAAMFVKLVREGLLTRNEARKEMGRAPYGDDGDVATVTTAAGPSPLSSFLGEDPDGDDDDDDGPDGSPGGGSGGGGSAEDEVQDPEAEEETGDNSPADRHAHRGLLPSEWPKASLFEEVRTVDLTALADIVEQYSRDVDPLYDEARDEILGAAQSIYREGEFGDAEAEDLQRRASRAIDKLEARWATATMRHYLRTAQIARDEAADLTGQPVVEDWRDRGAAYHERAMQYLSADEGLTGALRDRMRTIISAAQEADSNERATLPSLDGSAEAFLGALSAAWVSSKHRIKNWAGRLVELANQVLVGGMNEGSSSPDGSAGLQATEWFVEWVRVQDRATCSTCARQASLGFQRANQLSVVPGGATECQAKCRCVLVWWTRAEVENGTAVPMN